MMCPECGAWLHKVLETRQHPDEMIVRRRECANGHRFSTWEVHPTVVHKGSNLATQRAIRERRTLWQRDKQIRADTRPLKEIAATWGMTREHVVKIRRGVRR